MCHQPDANQLDTAAKTVNAVDRESAAFLAQLEGETRTRLERQLRLLRARLDLAGGNARRTVPVLQAILVATEGKTADRRDPEWLIRWIREPDVMLEEGDPIATELYKRYEELAMPNFKLSKSDAEAVIEFLTDETRRVEGEKTPEKHASAQDD